MASKTTGKLNLWITEMTDKISDTISTYLYENFTKIDTEFSAHMADSANKAHGGAKGALVCISASQAIPNEEYTKVVFGDVGYDTDNFFDSENPTKLTIPAGVSKVRLTAGVRTSTISTGKFEITIYKNDSGAYRGRPTLTWGGSYGNISSPVIPVSEGDYFELVVYQNSGSSSNLVGTTATARAANFMAIEVIE